MKNVLTTIKQLMNDKNINYLLRIYLRISFLIYFLYFINSKLQLIGNLYVFFYSRPDQFADILKLIYSFTHIFSIEDLLAMQVPENWIYKNPYNSVIYSQGATSNMGTTPLTIVFLTLTAKVSDIFLFGYRIPAVFFILLLVFLFHINFKTAKDNVYLSLFLVTSYPFLFLVDRGNIMAGICVFCLYIIFKKFIQKINFSYLDILLFIIASSIRPNLLVFGLVFLTDLTLGKNILKFFKIGVFYIFSNLIFYNIAKLLFPGYTLQKFNVILQHYFGTEVNIVEWNSSFYGFLTNLYSVAFIDKKFINFKTYQQLIDDFFKNQNLIYYITVIFLSIMLYAFKIYKQNKITEINLLICIGSVSILSSHPLADYHLFLFTIILILIYQYEIIVSYHSTILIFILLLPKFHIISSVLNTTNILNTIVLCILLRKNIRPIITEALN